MIGFLIVVSTGYAFQNEPDGFRGLKWGDPPGEDMVYDHIDKSNVCWYTRKNDKGIEGVQLRSICYLFYKDKFLEVWIQTLPYDYSIESFESLEDIVKLRFGPGKWSSWSETRKGEETGWWSSRGYMYKRFGDITTVIFSRQISNLETRRGVGLLEIRSTKIHNEYLEDNFPGEQKIVGEKLPEF